MAHLKTNTLKIAPQYLKCYAQFSSSVLCHTFYNSQSCFKLFKLNEQVTLGKGCGSVGRAVASNSEVRGSNTAIGEF